MDTDVMDPQNSTTFIKKPVTHLAEKDPLFEAKEILSNRLFLGYYEERRHVDSLKEYRDVVIVNPGETELIMDLDKIRQNLMKYNIKWVGITGSGKDGASSGCCLWVKLKNIPFGRFWFQIKQIKCENEEILLRLKCVRPSRAQDYEEDKKECATNSSASQNKSFSEDHSEYSFEFDPGRKLSTLYSHINDIVGQVRPHLTWKNFILSVKFLIAMCVILVTAMITCVRYLGDYILKLIREFTLILHAITPVLLQVIDCFSKIVGGLFILIAMMFKKGSPAPPPMQNQFYPPGREPAVPSIMPAPQKQILSGKNSVSAVSVPANWRERNRNLKMQLLNEM